MRQLQPVRSPLVVSLPLGRANRLRGTNIQQSVKDFSFVVLARARYARWSEVGRNQCPFIVAQVSWIAMSHGVSPERKIRIGPLFRQSLSWKEGRCLRE